MDLLCADHLTGMSQLEVPAETIWKGWALCGDCARERQSTTAIGGDEQPSRTDG